MAKDVPHPDMQEIAKFESGLQPLTIVCAPRRIVMHYVAEPELDELVSRGSSIHLTFFGVCFGSLISFAIVLSTSNISNPKTFAAYVALTAVALTGSALFGIKGYRDYSAARAKLSQLKRGQ